MKAQASQRFTVRSQYTELETASDKGGLNVLLQKEKKSKIKKLAEFLAEEDDAETESKEQVCKLMSTIPLLSIGLW